MDIMLIGVAMMLLLEAIKIRVELYIVTYSLSIGAGENSGKHIRCEILL